MVRVDAAMQHAACGVRSRGGALLFDFTDAFPSLAHAFLWAVLAESGLPDSVTLAIKASCIEALASVADRWIPWRWLVQSLADYYEEPC